MAETELSSRGGGSAKLAAWASPLRWLALIAASAVLVIAFEALHLPAALMLGPMAAAIAMAASGRAVRIPTPAFVAAQGVVGVMIASTMPVALFAEIVRQWPIFLAGTASTILASSCIGLLLTRAGVLPGTTAIWGSSPGAATTMTLMSDDFGADMRLVAFMQYLRVVCCAVSATVVARILGVQGDATAGGQGLFVGPAWAPVAGTVALALVTAWAGRRFRLPGGALLLPLAAGLIANGTGLLPLVLPPWLLAICYALVGWTVGIRFTPSVIAHAWRVFPRVLLSILSLIAICGLFACALVGLAGIDPLTAYLATSPGGADSVAIIAATTKVDVPFVMAMQIARFLFVLLVSPTLAKLMSGRTKSATGPT